MFSAVLPDWEGGSRQQDACSNTGSATAVLIWKNIKVTCDSELGLEISLQVSW